MEASGMVSRPISRFPGAGFRLIHETHLRDLSITIGKRFSGAVKLVGSSDSKVSIGPRKFFVGFEFSDDRHLQYYASPVRSGGKKKQKEKVKNMEIKKKTKLIKGLSKDLSAFYAMGFGVELEDGLVGEVKGKMISEAAQLLLAQLQQLRSEEKEMKRKRKEEKAAMKAMQMNDTSSSSSSESSDSECGDVVDMSWLRTGLLAEPKIDQTRSIPAEETPITTTIQLAQEQNKASMMADYGPVNCLQECSSISSGSSSAVGASAESIEICSGGKCDSANCGKECSSVSSTSGSSSVAGASAERIEVCMGGKCKRSGAALLLEEFERRVGIEGAVVGCKCMGKCRDGPNVRVRNECNSDAVKEGESFVRTTAINPLCIGVALEDVGAIVGNFFGEKKDLGGLLPA
eukprot:TRINITY_DN4691_c0_g1_i1.p1 TRINITY_DN4691_c0_g1~~TRINITY_DN4691_c0_g1_i1.p1  ORF type:complete len:425 (-),score=77.84 TRINITY_DN4691_c0_g1_i1:195-1403(-)